MLTHFGPGAFFLSECIFPSFSKLLRKVGVTTPQAPRCHSRRAVGSSRSIPSLFASDSTSSNVRGRPGVSSTGLFSSCARANGLNMDTHRARTNATRVFIQPPKIFCADAQPGGQRLSTDFLKPAV